MGKSAVVLCIVLLFKLAVGQIPDNTSGYVDVRPSAHMFWWLYGSTNPHVQRDLLPLVMWLQGGPGGSSTGFGNFKEIGPYDVNLNPRNTTWVGVANVLFVDNPVGTGYSYVDEDSAYTTNVDEIAQDLMTLFEAFLNTHTVFQNLPFYIFSESYGGKMSAAFALVLQQAINNESIHCNFMGVALGDSWISPIDYVNTWGPYLYSTSLLNEAGLMQVQDSANKTNAALQNGSYTLSTKLWDETQTLVEKLTDGVDFYNILIHNAPDSASSASSSSLKWAGHGQTLQLRALGKLHTDPLSALMNGPIKKMLAIPEKVVWGAQAGKVFEKQGGDFMKDVISTVDQLLALGVNVTVYNGQLDLICDTMGTLQWMSKLQWPHLKDFNSAKRVPLYPYFGKVENSTGAFYQSYMNLNFFWILKAGHMLPADAGEMALSMLEKVIHVNTTVVSAFTDEVSSDSTTYTVSPIKNEVNVTIIIIVSCTVTFVSVAFLMAVVLITLCSCYLRRKRQSTYRYERATVEGAVDNHDDSDGEDKGRFETDLQLVT